MNAEGDRKVIYENYLGIASFLRFVYLGRLYRSQNCHGESMREQIARSLYLQFIKIFDIHPPDNHMLMEKFKTTLHVEIHPPRIGFNDNEAHLWFRDVSLFKEEIPVFKMLNSLKDSVKEHPIVVVIEDKLCQIDFYGWGLCYHEQ